MKYSTIIYTILSIVAIGLWIPDTYFGWMILGFLVIDHVMMVINPTYFISRLVRVALIIPQIILGMLVVFQYLYNSALSLVLSFITLMMLIWILREFFFASKTHFPDKQSIEISVKREGTLILLVGIYLFLVGLIAVIVTSPVGKRLYYCLVVSIYGLLTVFIAREFVILNRRRLFILVRTVLIIILGILYRGFPRGM